MTDTTNGVPILPNIPISLHPGSLGNIAPALAQEGTVGARGLSIAQAALTTAYTAYAKVEEAVGSLPLGDEVRMVNGRPTKLAAGAVDELVAASDSASKRVLTVIQKNYDELSKIGQQLDEHIAAAIDDPARKTPVGLSVATEIRAHVKALPDGKRATFAYAAVEAGDKQTVAALLHAPAYLSGLTDKQMAALRQRAAHAFAPTETTQLEAIRNASDMVAAAGSRLVERFGRVQAMASGAKASSRKKIAALGEVAQ